MEAAVSNQLIATPATTLALSANAKNVTRLAKVARTEANQTAFRAREATTSQTEFVSKIVPSTNTSTTALQHAFHASTNTDPRASAVMQINASHAKSGTSLIVPTTRELEVASSLALQGPIL